MRGKKPTLRQKKAIKEAGWNPDNWLVRKHLPSGEIHLVHRHTGRKKVVSA